MDLPTEVFEHILDEVYNYRFTQTLRNCALVNHFFYSLSQPRLLRNVLIKLEPPDVRRKWPSRSAPTTVCAAQKFLDVLRRTPHLSPYVHTLTIVSDTLYPFIRSGTDHWIASDLNLPPLMQTLTNLRSFRVKKTKERVAGMETRPPFIISKVSEETIFNTLPRTLSEVVLELENVPFRYLQACHWIKSLSLLSLDCSLANPLPSPVRSTPHLLHLEIGSISSDLLSWLSLPACPLRSGCIESLTLVPRLMPDMWSVKGLGDRMKSVHEIRFDFSHLGERGAYMKILHYIPLCLTSCPVAFAQYNTRNHSLATAGLPLPNLESFPSLTTLSFSAAFSAWTTQGRVLIDYFTNPLIWITQVVSSLPPNQLRVLVLDFSFILDFSFVSSLNRFPHEVLRLLQSHWQALHTVLYETQPTTRLTLSLNGLDHEAVNIVESHLNSMNFDWHLL